MNIYNKAQIFSAILILSLLAMSCIDRIDLEAPAGGNDSVVVQGKLAKGNPSFAEVRVSRLFDFDGTEQLVTINKIVVEDEEGNVKELVKRQEGVYQSVIDNNDPEISIDFDKNYRVVITLVNREVIESKFEPLYEAPPINDLTFERANRRFENDQGDVFDIPAVNFLLNSAVPDDQNVKLLWDVERTFKFTDRGEFTCYVSSNVDLTDIKLLDPDAINQSGGDFNQVIYQADVDFSFAEGYYLTVKQESLSADAFEYFNNVSSVIDRSGNMFEPPAGKIKSNLTNITNDEKEIFGYFYVVDQKIARQYISREAVGNPDTICYQPVEMPPPGCPFAIGECCGCLSFDNSTSERPDFWTE